MNPPGFPAGEASVPSPSRRELQLQGPRPSPLSVSKDSHKIGKPPLPRHTAAPAGASRQHQQQPTQPVIIYSVSPKVINVPVDDFMKVVQRLTGPSSPSRSGDVSPAARLASIEKTSPSEKERLTTQSGHDDDIMAMFEGVEVSQFHGILSPAPATLPGISSEIFSPATDPETLSWLHDLSPFWSANSFMPSPSGLFSSTAIVSPIPSPDVFRIFD